MSHELLRLTSKICNTPLLVTEAYLDKVMQLIENRNNGSFELAVSDKIEPQDRRVNYIKDKKLGIVDIHGAISDVPYYGLCGEEGVSHQLIREEVAQLIDMGAKTIVLDQDSNGGMGHMAFESADYIRNLADEHGVRLISYVSGASHSASYVYSAVAHEVISNPSAEVGSIGVRVQLRNTNGYMRKLGIEDTYITAGEGKVPFDEDGNWDKAFLTDLKESVIEMYADFTGHVSMWRGLDEGDVIKLGAKTFSSSKAMSKGLVDKTMTLEEFKQYLENVTNGEEMNPVTKLFKPKKETEMSKSDNSVDLEAVKASLQSEWQTELQTQLSSLKAEYESKLSAKDAEVEQFKAALAAIESEKKLAKAESRKAQLVAVIGEAKAESKAKSLEALDDTAFNEVVEMLKEAKALAEDSDLFIQSSDNGQEVVDSDEEDTLEAFRAKEKARLEKLYSPRNN
jgi:ClpP class serine protease